MISKVDVTILGLLAEEPLYGYELLERFRDRGMAGWVEIARASVYQALRRLEAQGHVSGKQQEGTEGPDRRVYRISRSGRDRLHAGLVERFAAAAPYETDAGLALGFAHLLSVDEVRGGIAAREGALRARREALRVERGRLASSDALGHGAAVRLLELQDELARTELAWLASFRRDLARLRR
jgi:DNA-binding PadR family transcriptional regulator